MLGQYSPALADQTRQKSCEMSCNRSRSHPCYRNRCCIKVRVLGNQFVNFEVNLGFINWLTEVNLGFINWLTEVNLGFMNWLTEVNLGFMNWLTEVNLGFINWLTEVNLGFINWLTEVNLGFYQLAN